MSHLMFERAVLALGLLADDDEIEVVVPRFDARDTLDAHHVGEQIEITPAR